jgi:hypothetical protein
MYSAVFPRVQALVVTTIRKGLKKENGEPMWLLVSALFALVGSGFFCPQTREFPNLIRFVTLRYVAYSFQIGKTGDFHPNFVNACSNVKSFNVL